MNFLYRSLARDPIWVREWRASARLARSPWLMAGAVLVVTWGLVMVGALAYFSSPIQRGQALSQLTMGAGLLFVVLVGPALAASAVAAEREGKTWEPLLMTGLDATRIDRGKFRAVYTELALYLCMLLPAAGLAHVAGGVSVAETSLGIVMVFALGAISVRFGLAVSASLPTARSALLVTVLSSVVLALGGAAFSAFAVRWLDRREELAMAFRDAPIFWPMAVTRTRLGFDAARYLIVVPGLLYWLAWTTLRRFSIAGMSERLPDRTREHARAFARLVLPLSLTLGLVPFRERSEAFALEIVLALVVFAELVVLAGAAHASPHRGAAGLTRAVAGFVALPLVTELVARTRGTSLEPSPELHAMLLYGPTFAAFLYAVDALLRALATRPRTARLIVIGVALAGASLPILASLAIGLVHDAPPPSWTVAWSPLAVLNPEPIAWERIHQGLATWLGAAALLAVAAFVVRRRRAGLLTAPSSR